LTAIPQSFGAVTDVCQLKHTVQEIHVICM